MVGRETALGFHPALYYRGAAGAFSTFPALIARDNDPAGRDAAARLLARCRAGGLAAVVLVPERGDFNDDLLAGGAQALGARLAAACADANGRGGR